MADRALQLNLDGVAKLDQAIPAATLRAYAKAAPRLLQRVDAEWSERIRQGLESPTFFDVVDFSAVPALGLFIREASASLVAPQYRDSHRLTEARLRLVSPYPLGYLNWHVDHRDGPGLMFKLLIYLDDVEAGAGEFCYVPGSHVREYRETEEVVARTNGYRRYPGKRGSGIVFDTAGIHGPFANLSRRPRQTLLLSFARW